jgi:hypothetical protein
MVVFEIQVKQRTSRWSPGFSRFERIEGARRLKAVLQLRYQNMHV